MTAPDVSRTVPAICPSCANATAGIKINTAAIARNALAIPRIML
jgi:hypothetical protein